jgi:ABC-type glycerol-3-phosphate transport system permease component
MEDFLLPLLVLREADLQTVTVRLYRLVQRMPQNMQLAAAFLAMIPPLLVAIVSKIFSVVIRLRMIAGTCLLILASCAAPRRCRSASSDCCFFFSTVSDTY